MPGKVLKILSGPHLGAEVEVGDAPLTLGCGAGCDIIIDDRLAAELHLTLSLQNGSTLAQFSEKGFVQASGAGSRPVGAGESLRINDGDLVAIGSTYLCIGPAQGMWPQIALPDWVVMTGAGFAEAPRARETKAGEAETVQAGETAETPAAGEQPAADIQKKPGKLRLRGLKWAVIPVLAIIVAIAIPVFGLVKPPTGASVDRGKTKVVPAAAKADPKVALNDLTQKYALTFEVANGVPTLSGEVETTEDVQTVRKQALGLAPNTVLNVYARSEMVRAATAVITGYGFPVKVTSVQDGVLSAEGWAPSEEEWQRVLVDLSHDVPGVTKFNASILFLSSIQESIGEDLRRNGLIDVQVTLDNDTLRCAGILPSDKKTAWQECMAKWQKQYNVIRTVKDETVLTASETPEKPTAEEMKISSIVLSALPCFKTPTGESYYEGSVLPDGHVVESIGTTSVLLRRGDVVKEISVFGSSASAANELAAGGANGS